METYAKKLIVAIVVISIFAFVSNLLIDNPYTHRFIRKVLNEKVTEHTHLTLDFEAVKLSAFPPGVELYGIQLSTDAAPNKHLLKASQAGGFLSLWSLLFGHVRLSILEVNDLEVVWPPPWNFAGFLREPAPEQSSSNDPVAWPPDFDVPVEEISLKNMRAFFALPLEKGVPGRPSDLILTTTGADLEVEVDSWNDIRAVIKTQEFNAAVDENSLVENAKIDSVIELLGNSITVSRFVTKADRIEVGSTMFAEIATSSIPDSKTSRQIDKINLKASAKFSGDLSILGTYLETADTRGLVEGDTNVEISIPVESEDEFQISLSGKGKAHDAYLDGYRLFDSIAEFKLGEDGFYLPSIDVRIGDQSFGMGNGKILFTDDVKYLFDFSPDKLHLMDLLDAFGVEFDVIDTTITSPDLQLSGTGFPFRMKVNATGMFADMDTPATPYPKPDFSNPICIIGVTLEIDSKKMDFDGSQGHCFTLDERNPYTVQPGQTILPGAENTSPLIFSGPVTFNTKTGMDLLISSPTFSAKLVSYFAQIPLDGKGAIKNRIHGPYTDVKVTTQINLTNAKVAEIPLSNLSGTTNIVGKRLNFHNIAAKFEDDQILEIQSGSMEFDDTLTTSAKFSGFNIPLSVSKGLSTSFYPDFPIGFSLTKVTGELKGSLYYPLAMTGGIAADIENLTYGEDKLAETIAADFKITKDGWKSRLLQGTLGDLLLDIEVDHKRAFPFSFKEAQSTDNFWASIGLHPDDEFIASFNTEKVEGASSAPTPTDFLSHLPFAKPYLEAAGIHGSLNLTGKLRGTTSSIQGAFEGTISDTTVLNAGIAPVTFKGFLKQSKIDLVANHGGNSFEGRLSFDFLEDKIPYEWFFNFNQTDLRFAATELFSKDPRNFLYLDAEWRMKGHFTDFWRSMGELKIRDIRGKFVQDNGAQTRSFDIQQDEPVTVNFSPKGWIIEDDKALFLTGRHMRIRLSLPDSKPPENLGIKMTSIVDLGILKEFSADIESAAGKLRVITEIRGPVDDLDISVDISDLKRNPFIAATWRPVQIGLAEVRPPFRNIQAHVIYKNKRLIFENLTANKGAGTISASGVLNFDENSTEPSRLDVNFKDATLITPVAVLKSFETLVSGNVVVSGKGFPLRISGDVDIVRARSTREVDLRNEIFDALRRSSFRTELANEEPLFIFDLNVGANRSINIHNRNIKAVMSANLQIKGTEIAPVILGQIEINRGTFTYKREFNFVRGFVTFDNPIRPDPSLDILAQTDVGSYRVYLTTTGRASNPQIEFTTDPPNRENGSPISKLDVLILISKGDLPKEGQSFADSQNAALSEGISIFMSQIEDPFERILDLSGQNIIRTIYVDTYSDGGPPEPRVNVPLDLGEDFDVIYKQHTSGREITSEYTLHENVTVSGNVRDVGVEEKQANTSADASVDLKFRFSYE